MTNAKKVQQNIEDAIEALQSSLVVLESANKVNEQLEQKKYYAALKVHKTTFNFCTQFNLSICRHWII